MGELGSNWLYQEEGSEELKRKLQSTRMELEQVRLEVSGAKKQTTEKERQLCNLLQMACRERDEARELLYNLLILNDNNNSVRISDESNIFLKQQQLQFTRANSSITDSNTLSDSLFHNSYISSSPVESMFDASTSSEFPYVDKYDHATGVINELVKGKVLPRKGKLLEAVMEAGPLLETLMLAGPLPRWRNPPPIQPFKIPQVTPFAEMSCSSSSQMGSNNSMLNFSNGDARWVCPAMIMNNQIVVGKRQRLM